MKITVLLVCLAVFLLSICAIGQPVDVPQDHWAYDAVSSLAAKGLILGYPDGNFLGGRTVTRYEMASIIVRVLEYIESIPAPQTQPSAPVQSGSTTPSAPTTPEVTQTDLDSVTKLVNEYKAELAVIGADLQAYNDRIEKLEGELDSVKAAVTEPEGAIQANINDVKKLKTIKVSGYVQARYEYDQSTEEVGAANKNKNGFQVRRARIKVAGSPTDNTQAVIQIDAGGNSDANSVVTKDAYLDYYLKGNPTLGTNITFGQFKWPFGYQVVQSSSTRETPERSRVIRVLFPGERDRGIKFSTATEKKWLLETGLFNGTGANLSDTNNEKDVVGRLRYAASDNLDLGASWYVGKNFNPEVRNSSNVITTPASETVKNRFGADFQYYMKDMSIKAEYVTAKDLGFDKWGYWAQLSKNITKKDIAIVMYDVFKDPSNTKNGRLSSWNVGWARWLDNATRFRLFYEFNKEEIAEFDNDVIRVEMISLF
ncbi:MAG: porin [Armatimonadota bacterium]